nr:NUDIX hydrolase [Anaerolineae bacterium]
MSGERIVGSEHLFSGKVVNLRIDTVAREDGTTYRREIIQHSGAVAVIPVDQDGNVFLVSQYRAGAGAHLLEVPAGGLEPGEEPADCARRELQEEIGYFPGELIKLGGFYVAASYTTEFITIYLALDLSPSRLQGDVDEDIEIIRKSLQEAVKMVQTNQIQDSKSLIGLTWASDYLKVHTAE